MPKTKNIPRAQRDHATQSNLAPTSNSLKLNHNHNPTTTAATTLTSPPTRPRLHASRTTSHTNLNTNSAMATRHRRSKENSENPGAEKENTGRAGRSTRTHVTPGVLSTAFVSSNLATPAFTSTFHSNFTSAFNPAFNPVTNSNSNPNSTSILGTKSQKLLAAPAPAPAPPTNAKPQPKKKPTLLKRRAQKVPLQDVTAQFVAGGTGEGANRAGTAYAHYGEEEILALREEALGAGGGEGGGGGGGVELEAPVLELEMRMGLEMGMGMGVRVATPGRSRAHRNQGGQPTSPLPPSSPPSDYRMPSSALNFNSNLAPSMPPRPAELVPASPAQSIPVQEYDPVPESKYEYDPWGSFDSAPAVGSPTRPVAVAKSKEPKDKQDEDPAMDKEDPFGFAALERKLKADRAGHEAHEEAHCHEKDGEAQQEHEEHEEEDEDEDIDALPVADTSSPRPEGLLIHRDNLKRNRKRALEEEAEADDDDNDEMAEKNDDDEEGAAHRYGSSSPGPVIPRLRGSGAARAAIGIAAAGPASTPVGPALGATGTSPVHAYAHAHVATPPTPHKDARKRRRISSVLDAVADITHDVFGPCLLPSASSPGQVQAESPSPTKGSGRRSAAARVTAAVAVARVGVRVPGVETVRVPDHVPAAAAVGTGAVNGDALDAFNAVLDAQDAQEADPEPAEESMGRSLRPRASRVVLVEEEEGIKTEMAVKKEKKARSASRGRGRGRGLGRGASLGKGGGSKSRGRGHGRGQGKRVEQTEKEGDEDRDDHDEVVEMEMDSDEKFEQARQARIAYFRGLDAYEVETEDVYLV